MGRPSKVPLRDRIDVVKSFMHHFVTRTLPIYTSPVWIEMSKELNGRWTPHDVYINVRENRNNIVETARKELDLEILEENEVPKFSPIDATEKNRTSNDENSTSDSDDPEWCPSGNQTKGNIVERKIETKKLELFLTEDEWDSIKPNGTVVYGDRNTEILQRGVWTNVISIAFWKQYKTRCAFVYKRANVKTGSDNGSCIIDIQGKCKSSSCGNTFRGRGEKHPDDRGIVIYVDTRDTSLESHEEVKRPLNGARRQEAAQEIAREGSTVWKRRQAREMMQDGDLEPAFLPNGDVLRQAKMEGIHARLNAKPGNARDLIRTVENISADPDYADLVQAVGSFPFYVFFSFPAQLDAYMKYLKMNKLKSVISVDSTGSLVKSIIRPDGRDTGHIFLYSIVLNFEGLTQPVHQMLTEKHDIDFIEYWLRQWLRKGAGKPKEAVCDYSRALINALCLAFNNRTIKAYLDICFAIIENTQGVIERPSTIIRIDVAHFIHMVCRWPCFEKVTQPRIKDFFVRCVALMVECTTLHQFQKVFTLTCVVGLHTNQDSEVDLENPLTKTVNECRLRLEDYIATRRIEDKLKVHKPRDEIDYTIGPFKVETTDDTSKLDDDTKSRDRLVQWVALQRKRAGETVRDGHDPNAFYLPNFVERLYTLAKEFILWTGVVVPPSRCMHATSSYVEGHFNDIKTRVLTTVKAPARVDIFIKELALNIIGETRLFISKMKKTEMKLKELEKQEPEQKELKRSELEEKKLERKKLKKTRTIDAGTNQATAMKYVNDQTEIEAAELGDEIALERINQSMAIEQSQDTFISELPDPKIIKTGTDETRKRHAEKMEVVTNQTGIKVAKLEDTFSPELPDLHLVPEELSFIDSDAHLLEISSFVDISFNDSDLMSAEDWRAKAPLQKSVDDFSDIDPISDGQSDRHGPMVVPTSLLAEELNSNIYLEHSYSESTQSPQNAERNDHVDASIDDELALDNRIDSISVEEKENILPLSKPDETAFIEFTKADVIKASKYFKCFPEIRQRNLLTAKRMKPHLLPNGNLCRRGIQVDGVTVFVRNTCPFDSLVHILMTRAIDDVDYASLLENSTNETLNFVSTFMKNGLTSDVLLKRVNILKGCYEKVIAIKTEKRVLSYTINAWDSIENIVRHTMISEPSVYKREECSHCAGRTYSYATIAPNHNVIARKGFGALQTALAFRPVVNDLKCNGNCPGKFNLFSEPHVHLFIDLDIRNIVDKSPKQLRARSQRGLDCTLESLPLTIELSVSIEGRKKTRTVQYSLAGLVGYKLSHFIAYCRRDSGAWQVYNNLHKKIVLAKSSQTMNRILPYTSGKRGMRASVASITRT